MKRKRNPIFWRIGRLDFLIGLTWMPVGCLVLVIGASLLGVLQMLGLLTLEDAGGACGIAVFVFVPMSMYIVSKALANYLGVRCPGCDRVLSAMFMRMKHRNQFIRTRACPYCGEKFEDKPEQPDSPSP